MTPTLTDLDLTALRAWPAAEERRLGEWLLRLDAGYTKRANSVYVLGREPNLDLKQRLSACAAIYHERGLPLIVRESTQVASPTLAAAMTARGSSRIDETIVMTAAIPIPGDGDAIPDQVDLDNWLELYTRFEGATKGNQRHHREIIRRIASPTCLVVRHVDGEPAAIGLAVADEPWVGLFDIATDTDRRRQGHGRSLVAGMLAWGWRQGARQTYLQVLASNAPAIALYKRLGFREAYRYWYWTEPRG
jgi:ribosomal protein S18 acetylase RimI-like enzyme